jgi:GH43 family beta-xylosidase
VIPRHWREWKYSVKESDFFVKIPVWGNFDRGAQGFGRNGAGFLRGMAYFCFCELTFSLLLNLLVLQEKQINFYCMKTNCLRAISDRRRRPKKRRSGTGELEASLFLVQNSGYAKGWRMCAGWMGALLVGCIMSCFGGNRQPNSLPIALGDPFLLKASDGIYYLYGTSDDENEFKTYSSQDLVHWTDRGRVYEGARANSWALDCFWAPEVYEREGKYYLWFSANWKENPNREAENFRIGVAVADRPTGPFRELYDRPVFDPGYPVIDANLLFDNETGRVYLYYSRCCYKHPVASEIADWAREQNLYSEIEESWIYGVELKPDFSGIIGEPQLLLAPPQKMNDPQSEWESRSVTAREVNRRWTEGSFILKHQGRYYLMYSANYWGGENYAVGYATSQSPLGPFQKANNNPVLQKNTENGGDVTGTGHNMVLSIDGKLYCVYHGRTQETGNRRIVFLDPMEILPDGRIQINGPVNDFQ